MFKVIQVVDTWARLRSRVGLGVPCRAATRSHQSRKTAGKSHFKPQESSVSGRGNFESGGHVGPFFPSAPVCTFSWVRSREGDTAGLLGHLVHRAVWGRRALRRRAKAAFAARALRHLCSSGGCKPALLRDDSAGCRWRPLPGWGSLCGMAMAEGERAECAEPPQDEPPADGALKRAEELKTQANDYFKGAPAPEGARVGGQLPGSGGAGPARNHGNCLLYTSPSPRDLH